jgi:hypothetical protein
MSKYFENDKEFNFEYANYIYNKKSEEQNKAIRKEIAQQIMKGLKIAIQKLNNGGPQFFLYQIDCPDHIIKPVIDELLVPNKFPVIGTFPIYTSSSGYQPIILCTKETGTYGNYCVFPLTERCAKLIKDGASSSIFFESKN